MTPQSESHVHSPQVSMTPAETGNVDYFSPFQEVSGYPTTWQSQVPKCDCFQWQTSNLMSLHTLKPPAGMVQNNTSGEILQYINGTISACQRTVACPSCEKGQSMLYLLIASLQMVFDHLEALLYQEKLNSSPSSFQSISNSMIPQDPHSEQQQKAIRMMQIRHMLIKTQKSLQEIQQIVPLIQQRFSVDSAISGFGDITPGSWSNSDYLHQSVNKSQGGIGSLLSNIGISQA